MSQANAQQRNLTGEPRHAIDRDAGFARRAGPRRDDQVRWLLGGDLIERDLVVAMHFQIERRVDFTQPLHEVVGERIVIVDKQDHAPDTNCRKRLIRSRVTGPGSPEPISRLSTFTTGMTSAAVPVRNISSAT